MNSIWMLSPQEARSKSRKDQRDPSHPSVDPSTEASSEKKPFLSMGNREKAEVSQIIKNRSENEWQQVL